MTPVEILTYALSIAFGVIVIVSYFFKLSWYMENYQSRPWRGAIGEDAFGAFSYLLGAVLIGMGAYKIARGLGFI